MADSQITLTWTGEGLNFEAAHAAYAFKADGDGAQAHSPVQSLLLALASCAGADVIDITKKMRVAVGGLEVVAEGDRMAEPPRYFTAIRLRFIATGAAPEDRPKIERAIELSHEKYCSVFHSLRSDIDFSTELVLG